MAQLKQAPMISILKHQWLNNLLHTYFNLEKNVRFYLWVPTVMKMYV
jgi:hypothetical protein